MRQFSSLTILLAVASVTAVPFATADDEQARLAAFLEEIDATVQNDGVPAAVKKIELQNDAADVVRKYFIVSNHFYRKHRDIDRMLELGQAGIDYALDQAAKSAKTDPERAERLKGYAKSMAYNMSVNAWPGWDEKGIKITPQHSKQAYQAALQNLRLGVELKRSADVLGNAHWLVGAQHLALEQPGQAIEQFKKAIEQFSTAEKPDYRHMAAGYLGIAQLTQAATRQAGRKTLDKALADLKARDTGDARFFISQLKTVERVLVDSSDD